MKKILCGALVLLAAVAAFTSCKKKDNNGDAISSLILSATELQMSPGDDAKKLTVKTNTGKVVNYEWSTDDADNAVITLSAKSSAATITPVGVGTATITVCLKDDKSISAECVVTVVDKLQSLKFSRLSYNYGAGLEGYDPPQNIDSTKVYIYSVFKDGNQYTGQADTFYCYLGDIRFRLLADGETWVSNDGWLTGKSNNGAYTIEAVGRVPVLANSINKRIYQHFYDYDNGFSQAAKDEWIKPTYYELGTIAGKYGMTWGSSIKQGQIPDTIPYSLYAGSLENEAKYVELMTKAYVEDYPSNPQSYEDYEAFYQTRDLAIAEVKGAILQHWIYNDETGHWQPSAFVAGIVPTLDFEIINNTNEGEVGYLYTDVITMAQIIIKPFDGLDNCGVDLNYNKLTKQYEANSDQFQWGETIDCSFGLK